MPTLHEYIGSLVAGITNARMMADLQTASVAAQYAKHDLLQYFSVPRMTIDDIEMTIPLALEELEERTVYTHEPVDTIKFATLANKEMQKSLGIKKLPASTAKQIQEEAEKLTSILNQQISKDNSLVALRPFIKALFDVMLNKAQKYIQVSALREKNARQTIEERLEKLLTPSFRQTRQQTLPGNVKIIAETHKLKEIKPENLFTIKIKISEQGVEWVNEENSKGEVVRKLLPE